RRRAVAVTEAEAIRLISDTVPRRGARNGHVSPRQVGAGVARAGAAVARAGHDAARAGPPSALRRRDGPPCAALGGGAGARTYTSCDAGAAGRLALHALPGPRVGLAASLTAGVGLLVMVPLLALVGVDASGGATQALVERFGAALQGLGLPLSAPVLLALNALVLVATAAVGRYQSVLEARALEE